MTAIIYGDLIITLLLFWKVIYSDLRLSLFAIMYLRGLYLNENNKYTDGDLADEVI